ncbi:MAG TPA: PIN domain-containing protein [Candidatus Limnocylindria bacterium]
MTAFVDTSALFALLDGDDDAHVRARSIFERIGPAEDLVTHQYVVVETLALVQRRLRGESVRRLALELLPVVTTEPVDEDVHAAAIASLLASLSARRSFVDLVSFEFMRQHGISRAFAFDTDFERAGFTTLA